LVNSISFVRIDVLTVVLKIQLFWDMTLIWRIVTDILEALLASYSGFFAVSYFSLICWQLQYVTINSACYPRGHESSVYDLFHHNHYLNHTVSDW